MQEISTNIQKLIDSKIDNQRIHGINLKIESGAGEVFFRGHSGNLTAETHYFIASVTKLYTTAIIMKSCSENLISLDKTIADFLTQDQLKGLHVYRNIDYSSNITIQDLLAHTSGLPDYLSSHNKNEESLQQKISKGEDISWDFEDVLKMTKNLTPLFEPNSPKKAFYSDSNFQILGKIIEIIRDKPIKEVFEEEIFKPLKLSDSYVFNNQSDQKPFNLYFGKNPLRIPLAMSSFKADGGIVSTIDDCMTFLKAFFTGYFFPEEYLIDMIRNTNRIFFPLQYGIGLMKFQLPRFFTLFKKFPPLYGHSGLSGAFAYYVPDMDMYFTGTVNQIVNPGLSYRMLIQLLSFL